MTAFPLALPRRFSRRTAVGVAAVAAVIALWSSFALSTRALEGTGLTMMDAALIRFAVPAVLLTPWIPRTVRALRAERASVLALLLLAGLPHFLLFAWGAHLTSAALTGLLVPGTVPLFVTLLVFARSRRAPSRAQTLALAAIVAGVGASAVFTGGPAGPGGILVLLAAGFVWAAYTLGLARTRLDPVAVIVVVSVASAASALLLAATGVAPSNLLAGTADVSAIGAYGLLQGVGTGLLSTACYVVAVRNLGSRIPSAAGALSPVVTAVAAVPLLGEPLTAGLTVALALIVAGVAAFTLTPATTRQITTPR